MSWLDHPTILKFYLDKRCIDGEDWTIWISAYFEGAARSALDLGCGSGGRSLQLLELGVVERVFGWDISEGRLEEARRQAKARGLNALFERRDINTISLEPHTLDVIFSAHSFHHFLELEHVMAECEKALTPRGLFILEEFVGPSVFQWTDLQIAIVNDLLTLIPERYRLFSNGVLKTAHARPTIEAVQSVSPFESIRSAEIVPLFRKHFDVLYELPLGGTLQHLLYDGIIHNFQPHDYRAEGLLASVNHLESILIESHVIPSDFMLLIGTKKIRKTVHCIL